MLRHALAMLCEVSKCGITVPEVRGSIYQLSICCVLAFFYGRESETYGCMLCDVSDNIEIV